MQEAHVRVRESRASTADIGDCRSGASWRALTGIWLLMIVAFPCSMAPAQPPQKSEIYFSQGQALYYADDLPRSRLEATQDLVRNGVLQAVAALLGPAVTQSMYGAIQEKILSNKEKFVDGYQLASEGPGSGLYRVTGQVTVSREILVQALREHGFHVASPEQSLPLVEHLPDLKLRAAAGPNEDKERPGQETAIPHTKPEVLWVVTENWGAEWRLPSQTSTGKTVPLAMAVMERAKDLQWAPRFAPSGAVQFDRQGNIDPGEISGLSREMGLERVVTGKSWLAESPPGSRRLLASVRMLDVPTGESGHEIQAENAVDGESIDEGIIGLAEAILPSIGQELSLPGPSAETVPRSDTEKNLGIWTIRIRAAHPQSAWEAVRKEIEGRFKAAQTSGFELESNEITVRIENIDGRVIREDLNGRQVSPGGPTVLIEGFSEEEHSMVVVFGSSGPGEQGPRQ